jgi:hypothetical protein
MALFKKILPFILIFGFVLFGIFNSELYSERDSFHFIISYHSLFLLLLISAFSDFFKLKIFNLNFYELLVASYWKNSFLFLIYIFLPLLVSIPLLISKNINDFVIIFASCHFQAIIIISFFKLFINHLKNFYWDIFVMINLFSLVLSNRLASGEYLLLNPLLGITFLPNYFKIDVLIQRILLVILLTYSIVGLMYIVNSIAKKNSAHNNK